MLWQIEDIQFDSDRKLLIQAGRQILLEPKAAAMLEYFCAHPNKNISRDELLATVWQGQVVTDNAINRVVVQLRKALADEDQIKQFIATIPKVGYRFIAAVGPASADREKPQSQHGLKIAVLAICIVAIVVWLSLWKTNPQTVVQQNAAITPLTRLSEIQSDPALSYAGDRLLYTGESTSSGQALFILDMESQLPVRVSMAGGNAYMGAWAHDDSFLIYLFLTPQSCAFHRVAFVDKVPQQPQVIYQCPVVMETNFALSHDNKTLYFVEQPADFEPYKVYALDLQSQRKRQLSQPIASGLGNHYVDMHPDGEQLLVLSNPEPGMTDMYVLNTQSNSFQLQHSFGYAVYSAIWGAHNNTIVHPGQHPSYQLMQTDLNSGESHALLSDSRRISSPARMHNGQDYLFTSYLYNRDIILEGVSDTELNSTVMDYLPALSADGAWLAFVSKRSGYSKIWLKDLKTGALKSIEPPDRGRWFYSLHWSFDQRRILANTSNGLIQFDLESGQISAALSTSLPVFSASWFNQTEWVYSVYEDSRWQAYRYNPESQETTALSSRWAFVKANAEQSVFIDQDNQMYLNGDVLIEGMDCAGPIIWRYSVGIKLDKDDVYCVAADARTDLLRWNPQSGVQREAGQMESGAYFSVAGAIRAKTIIANAYSDIMRTNFTRP
ncbi:winged helix-turn-helix domain-containing protein [Marinicella sp. W31]|uniref:winged helix-turn-helix domain-containing protein n=1 Tax=Marinicella sp. W31 TaxID=3023713 RepID=UPI0037566DA2